jgi:DNA-binding response OmpR family regulator
MPKYSGLAGTQSLDAAFLPEREGNAPISDRAMTAHILIVEDEFLVAANLEAMIEDLGHAVIGVAPDAATALTLADSAPDVALVDVNLADGPSGAQVGAMLSRIGTAVVYLTANPAMLGDGVPGTIGVIAKPCDGKTLEAAIAYALDCRSGARRAPPANLTPFADAPRA